MTPRLPAAAIGIACLLGLLAFACSDDTASVSAAPAQGKVVAGTYEVSGETESLVRDERRRVAGTVILAVEGDHYTTTFDLKTTFPGRDEELTADVIGSGDGRVEGGTLTGTAEMQLIVSTVPGVDTRFAFIPRIVGARVQSASVATFDADGRIHVEIDNTAAVGEDNYQATRTILEGKLIEPVGHAAD